MTRRRVVVDAANVVGSVPDGWWRDRPGAARRLLDRLAGLLATPGPAAESLATPGPAAEDKAGGAPAVEADARAAAGAPVEVVVVLEGQARTAAPEGAYRSLVVVHAPAGGDDAVVAAAAAAPARTVVVTSDRDLRRRVEALGARTAGPRGLDDLVLGAARGAGQDAAGPAETPPGEAARE